MIELAHGVPLDVAEYAQICYDYLLDYTGPPKDSDRTLRIEPHDFTGFAKDRFNKNYVILVNRDSKYREQWFAAVGHEMYHRMSFHIAGLRDLVWVDEMLAFVASHQLLVETGFTAYANQRVDQQRSACNMMCRTDLKSVRLKRSNLLWHTVKYPSGFYTAVVMLGIELLNAFGWDSVIGIVNAQTWEQWFDRLDSEKQCLAREILASAIV